MRNGVLLVAACIAAPASAQSISIDFGGDGSAPTASYSAAGRAGFWNDIGVMPTNVRFSLKDLAGRSVTARVYNQGATAMLMHNAPATAGDDEALIDDMFLSYNNPVDACIFFENLRNGAYEVIIYALTPNDPGLMCRVRVDYAAQGATWIGGAWPGAHQEGVTFARFDVNVTNGTLWLHSGQYGAFYQSGINGIQIIHACPEVAVQPGPATVSAGGSATFTVAAEGAGTLSYRWRRNNVDVFDGGGLSGTASATLTINPVAAANAGTYSVRITNTCGATISDGAALVVNHCGSADFNGDGDTGTDQDIEAFFACLGGNCCGTCGSADFDGDGDTGTDTDIEAFFRVLGGGAC